MNALTELVEAAEQVLQDNGGWPEFNKQLKYAIAKMKREKPFVWICMLSTMDCQFVYGTDDMARCAHAIPLIRGLDNA